MNSELRLRAGVQASVAVATLRPLIALRANVVPSAGPPNIMFIQWLQARDEVNASDRSSGRQVDGG